jgi:hypothetical protein
MSTGATGVKLTKTQRDKQRREEARLAKEQTAQIGAVQNFSPFQKFCAYDQAIRGFLEDGPTQIPIWNLDPVIQIGNWLRSLAPVDQVNQYLMNLQKPVTTRTTTRKHTATNQSGNKTMAAGAGGQPQVAAA